MTNKAEPSSYDDTVTKAQIKAKFSTFISRASLESILVPGSDEFDFALKTTRHLPVVYSELQKETEPKFAIKQSSSCQSRKQYRALHIWKEAKPGLTGKWLALTQAKIFASETKTSKKKRVQIAFRTAIKGQIDYVRSMTLTPFSCPLSNVWITDKTTNCEVDHYGPKTQCFQALLEQWMTINSLHYDLIALDRKGDIKEPEVFMSWYSFHKKHADLRLVDKQANRKKGARGN